MNPIDAQPASWESDPTIKAPPVGQRATWEPNRPLPPDPSMIGTTLRDPISGDPYERELMGIGDNQPKPVSHILAERIKTQGAYKDIPTYMADVRMEAYKLAPQLGVDLRTPEGQEWVKATISDAEKAFPHYVSPPSKDTIVKASPGESVFINGKWTSPDDNMGGGIQAPTIPPPSSQTTSDPREALVNQARAEMNRLLANGKTNHPRMPQLQKILDDADDRAAKLKEEGRKDEKLKNPPEKVLPAGSAEKLADAKTALEQLNYLEGVLKKNVNTGGPLEGIVTGANPYAEDTQKFEADIRTTRQMIGKYLEGGVLRKEDEAKYIKMLPSLTDTVAVREKKLTQVRDALSRKIASDIDSFEKAGYNVEKYKQAAPQPAQTQFITGKKYADKSGKVHVWDGTKMVATK